MSGECEVGGQATKVTGRAAGGQARAKALSPERRKEISMAAAKAKAEIKLLPKATHGSADHPLRIGDIEIPCYVLEDGTRVLTQRGFREGLGMSQGSSRTGDARHIALLESEGVKAHLNNDLLLLLKNPIKFQNPRGGGIAFGYPATVLADYCESILAARRAGTLPGRQSQVAEKCEILVRGFARVGIIALVDEATGYQKDRAKDALAQILEAFVAKELQPYMKTFPADYYEQLFRLYGLQYPPVGNKSWRPGFLGNVTNEVVYRRLAPDLLPELKKAHVGLLPKVQIDRISWPRQS